MSADIGQMVRDRLAGTSQVTEFCGPDKIFADMAGQSAEVPFIVTYVSGVTTYEDLNSADRCGPAAVEVLAYGRDRDEANRLAHAIRTYALPANLQGVYHGMDVREVSLVAGPAEVVDPPQDGSDRFRRVTQQTFSIWANAL